MLYKAKIKIKGYHGTYSDHLESIRQNNFRESVNDKWFGNAVYFFVEGISEETPAICAEKYACASAYNKDLKCFVYKEYAVLEAEIKVVEDKFLDLTVEDGARTFNKFRATYIEKILNETGRKAASKITDVDMLDEMRRLLGIEFVKKHEYIKFADQRRLQLGSKIDNVTIFAVNNPAKNINKHSIQLVKTGSIQ